MKIALFTQFYDPEACAAANRAGSLARALVQHGHDVTVVTNFPSFPQGKLRPGDARRFGRREDVLGVRVVRVHTATFGRMPGRRLAHWLWSAAAMSVYAICTKERFDAVLVTLPPVTLGAPALAARVRHRAKLIVDVRDVYPDIAIAMGKWRENGLLARVTERVARALYARASLIVAVTPTALAQIAGRGVERERLLLASNGCEDDVPGAARNGARHGGLRAIYAGNLGVATDVDILLDAAGLLRCEEAITITICGGGAESERVRRRVESEGLRNVRLTGAVERARAMEMIAASDVAIVPLRKGIRESVPTKIYDALSVGCPVVVAADGEAQAAAAAAGSMSVEAGNAGALAAKLRELAALDRPALHAIGDRGRAFVQRFYRREAIALRLCERIASL